jgi:hypothetical protein
MYTYTIKLDLFLFTLQTLKVITKQRGDAVWNYAMVNPTYFNDLINQGVSKCHPELTQALTSPNTGTSYGT